ncbi:hypothetical protein [Streptomyces sp. HC307]|uniref:hypothetical protein n=1 Tax=Streptomyces flavusporus TaxID=3385496 RepID=UPI00391765F7
MDEGRDDTPSAGRRHPLASAGSRLSPLQQAWSEYVTHATHCPVCRDIDRGRCDQAEQLWHAYREQGDDAYRRLHGETA